MSDELGNVTGLVDDAGMSRDGLLLKYRMEVYERDGHEPPRRVPLLAGGAPRDAPGAWGRIVSMSSAVAIHGNAGQTAYATTKSGLAGLTKSLPEKWEPRASP